MKSICEILKESKTIAVVGLSDKPGRDSGPIARFLAQQGYNVFGVHPLLQQFGQIPVYKSLKEIPEKIHIVDVFLNSNLIPRIMPDVLEVKPKTLWLQLGVRNDEAVLPAEQNGIIVISNKCIKIEYWNCGF